MLKDQDAIGDGTAVTFIEARHRTVLSIATRKTGSDVSPAGMSAMA